MTADQLRAFAQAFNGTDRTLADLWRTARDLGISLDALGVPEEHATACIWTIAGIGRLQQCKDCRSLVFVGPDEALPAACAQ